MQDVTDRPFWKLMAHYGGPDLYYTEYFRIREGFKLERPIPSPSRRPATGSRSNDRQPYPVIDRRSPELQQTVAPVDLNPAARLQWFTKCAGERLLRDPDRVDAILARCARPCRFRSR